MCNICIGWQILASRMVKFLSSFSLFERFDRTISVARARSFSVPGQIRATQEEDVCTHAASSFLLASRACLVGLSTHGNVDVAADARSRKFISLTSTAGTFPPAWRRSRNWAIVSVRDCCFDNGLIIDY